MPIFHLRSPTPPTPVVFLTLISLTVAASKPMVVASPTAAPPTPLAAPPLSLQHHCTDLLSRHRAPIGYPATVHHLWLSLLHDLTIVASDMALIDAFYSSDPGCSVRFPPPP